MSFEYFDEPSASTAAWLSASRADRRARAEALRRAGEMARNDLLNKYAISWSRKEIVAEMRALGISISAGTLREVLVDKALMNRR